MWSDTSLWFWLAFLWWLAILSSFLCATWPFIYFFGGKWLFRSFGHILIGLFGGYIIDLYRFLYFFNYLPHIRYIDLQIFSHILWEQNIAFSFWSWFSLMHRNFSVWCNPTCLFLVLLPIIWLSVPRNHCQDHCQGIAAQRV